MMRKYILFCILLWLSPLWVNAQGGFTNNAAVFSSGGNWSGNNTYQHFSVIGEPVVNEYISNNTYSGTLGFIFQDEMQAVAPPLKAMLIYPQNNAILANDPGNPITIMFYWVAQQDVSFNLQLSRDINFSNKIADTTVSTNYFELVMPLTGELYWRVQSSKGQYVADWSDTWKFNLLLTDVGDETEKLSHILLYPNPADDILNMVTDNSFINSELEITDILGNKKYKSLITGNSVVIDLLGFESGVYFIRAGNYIVKFVKY